MVLLKEIALQIIFKSLQLVIMLCIKIVFLAILAGGLIFPAGYDVIRYLSWKLCTNKMRKSRYRKSLRGEVNAKMRQYRYGWYELYIASDGVYVIVRDGPPPQPGFHRAVPGNKYWRSHVRSHIYSHRVNFGQSATMQTVRNFQAITSL